MMQEHKERAVYVAPVTERFVVKMEGGFMAGSVIEGNQNTVSAGEQQVNQNWDSFNSNEYQFGGW